MPLIHIVEDNDFLRLNIRTLLQVNGYEVEAFVSGEAAVPAIMRNRPDLVLCDILMPGITGLEVLRQVRSIASCRWTQFVVISASAESGTVREAMILGADDFVTKPFRNEELLETVRTRLKWRAVYQAELAAEWREGARMLVAGFLGSGGPVLRGPGRPCGGTFAGDAGATVPAVVGEPGMLDGLVSRYGAFCAADGNRCGGKDGGVVDVAGLVGQVAADAARRFGRTGELELDLREARAGVSEIDLAVALEGLFADAFSGMKGWAVRVECGENASGVHVGIGCSLADMQSIGFAGAGPGTGVAVCRRIAAIHGWEFSVARDGATGPCPRSFHDGSGRRDATLSEWVMKLIIPEIL